LKQPLNNFSRIAVAFAIAFAWGGDLPAHAHGYKNGTIEVRHPWTSATAGPTAIVSMKLTNVSAKTECLVSATAAIAQSVSLVESPPYKPAQAVNSGQDAATIICLEAGKTADLRLAGAHVRLSGLSSQLAPYDRFPMMLVFEHSGPLKIEVMIEEEAAK
jgi:periplasmic copper chaperone A